MTNERQAQGLSQTENGITVQEHQQALYTLLQEFDRVCRELEIPYVLFAGSMLGAVRHQGFIPWDDDLDVIMLREDYERFLAGAERVLDRERFFLQKEFSAHWPMFFSKLRLNNTACLEKYHPKDPKCHQGVYMDIFPCDHAAKTLLGQKVQFWASKVVIAKALYARGYDTDSKSKKVFMAVCRALPLQPFLKITKMAGKETQWVHTFLAAGSSFEKSVFERSYFQNRQLAPFGEGSFPIPAAYDPMLRRLYGEYMELPPEEAREIKQHAILVDLNNSYEQYEHYRDGMRFDVLTRSIR